MSYSDYYAQGESTRSSQLQLSPFPHERQPGPLLPGLRGLHAGRGEADLVQWDVALHWSTPAISDQALGLNKGLAILLTATRTLALAVEGQES